MPVARTYCLWGLCLLFLSLSVYGQKGKLISGTFDHVKFDHFAQQMESATDFRFFYNPSDLDSFYITLNVKDIAISNLLQQVFHNTAYQVAIDSLDNIYISKFRAIMTVLPYDYFNITGRESDSVLNKDLVLNETSNKGRAKVSMENRLFVIGTKTSDIISGKATVAGYVRDGKNGEPVMGASV